MRSHNRSEIYGFLIEGLLNEDSTVLAAAVEEKRNLLCIEPF